MDRTVSGLRVRPDFADLPDALTEGVRGPSPVSETIDDALAPQVFVRAITAVAAMPWDQVRAVRLEATLNAPMPLTEVAFVIRRLTPWRPKSPSRFAVVYARHADIGDGLTVTADLDGQAVPVHFPSPARQRARVRLLLATIGVAALATFLLISVTAAIWMTRSEASQRLELLEQQADRRLHEARTTARNTAQAEALDALGLREHRASAVLDELAWTAKARKGDARIEAFHWENGVLAVEARGEETPFAATDRPVRRSERPVRAGVWLWGVDPGAAQ